MRVILPILFNTEETARLSELDINVDINKYDQREVIFYRIDAIAPYMPGGKNTEFTTIFASGDEFICTLSMEEVDKLLSRMYLLMAD